MRSFLLIAILSSCVAARAGSVTITLDAPAYADKHVVLYRYMDPFTLRLERIADARTDAQGHAVLTTDVQGTVRAQLRINEVVADLYLREGQYHVQMPAPDKNEVRTIGGTARVDLIFLELDPLDVNALVSDLNARLDAFLAENLATDPNSGMEAVAKARSGQQAMVPDTTRKKPDLFVSPRWNEARVDTFARKLRKFYAEVHDPWFQSDVEYGLAGLRLGPRTDDRNLFNHYFKDRPVLYDVPEYARFLSNFFADFLLRFPFRTNTVAFQADIKNARTDSLKALLARNDFLKDDRLCELVLITGLYAQEANKQLDRPGILSVLGQIRDRSAWPEHRQIADNMLWDLTAMSTGSIIPSVAVLDTSGQQAQLDNNFTGRTCLLVSTIGNPYSERELVAIEQLRKEYGGQVQFVGIALDQTPQGLAHWLRSNPDRNWPWFIPADQQRFLGNLRIHSAPVLYILEGKMLTAAPGPLPSQGLAAILHSLKVKDEESQRLRPDRGIPPPKR